MSRDTNNNEIDFIAPEDEKVEQFLAPHDWYADPLLNDNEEQAEIRRKEQKLYQEDKTRVKKTVDRKTAISGGGWFLFTAFLVTLLAVVALPAALPVFGVLAALGTGATIAVRKKASDDAAKELKKCENKIKERGPKRIAELDSPEQRQAKEKAVAEAKAKQAEETSVAENTNIPYPPHLAVTSAAFGKNLKLLKDISVKNQEQLKTTDINKIMKGFNSRYSKYAPASGMTSDFYDLVVQLREKRGVEANVADIKRALFVKTKDGKTINSTYSGGGINVKNMTPEERRDVFAIIANADDLNNALERAKVMKQVADMFSNDRRYGARGNEGVFKLSRAEFEKQYDLCEALVQAEATRIQAAKDKVSAKGIAKKAYELAEEAAKAEIAARTDEFEGFDPNYSGYESKYNDRAKAKKSQEEAKAKADKAAQYAQAVFMKNIAAVAETASGNAQFTTSLADLLYPTQDQPENAPKNAAVRDMFGGMTAGSDATTIAIHAGTAKWAASAANEIAKMEKDAAANNAVEIVIRSILKAHGVKKEPSVLEMAALVALGAGTNGAGVTGACPAITGDAAQNIANFVNGPQRRALGDANSREMRNSTGRKKLVVEAMLESVRTPGAAVVIDGKVKELITLAITGDVATLKSKAAQYEKDRNATTSKIAGIATACIEGGEKGEEIVTALMTANAVEQRAGERFKNLARHFSPTEILELSNNMGGSHKKVKVEKVKAANLESDIKKLAKMEDEDVQKIISHIADSGGLSGGAAADLQTAIDAAREANRAERAAEEALALCGRAGEANYPEKSYQTMLAILRASGENGEMNYEAPADGYATPEMLLQNLLEVGAEIKNFNDGVVGAKPLAVSMQRSIRRLHAVGAGAASPVIKTITASGAMDHPHIQAIMRGAADLDERAIQIIMKGILTKYGKSPAQIQAVEKAFDGLCDLHRGQATYGHTPVAVAPAPAAIGNNDQAKKVMADLVVRSVASFDADAGIDHSVRQVVVGSVLGTAPDVIAVGVDDTKRKIVEKAASAKVARLDKAKAAAGIALTTPLKNLQEKLKGGHGIAQLSGAIRKATVSADPSLGESVFDLMDCLNGMVLVVKQEEAEIGYEQALAYRVMHFVKKIGGGEELYNALNEILKKFDAYVGVILPADVATFRKNVENIPGFDMKEFVEAFEEYLVDKRVGRQTVRSTYVSSALRKEINKNIAKIEADPHPHANSEVKSFAAHLKDSLKKGDYEDVCRRIVFAGQDDDLTTRIEATNFAEIIINNGGDDIIDKLEKAHCKYGKMSVTGQTQGFAAAIDNARRERAERLAAGELDDSKDLG